MLSLLVSLSLPHWVITVETSPSPSHSSASSSSAPPPSHPPLHLHIGLFSVCPEWRLEANLSLTEVAVVECQSLSYSQEEEEDIRTVLAPLGSRTVRVLSRMRCDCDSDCDKTQDL